MPIAVSGSNIVFADGSSIASGFTGFKNRIINGAMVIDQRNAGAAATVNTWTVFSVDRFFGSFRPSTGTATIQQVSDAPVGFRNSLRLTQASVTSLASSDYYGLVHRIEGFNTADLMFGTANAKTFTLSFWVKSSVTGTYGLSFQNINATRRAYITTYTINAANTWEFKTITVNGDTSGIWETTNSTGIAIQWDLGSGSDYQSPTLNSWQTNNVVQASGATRWIATSGATFQVTGVQLEAGPTVTSFDYRPYGTELALCQRYAYKLGSMSLAKMRELDRSRVGFYVLPVEMRTSVTVPAISTTDGISVSINNQTTRGFTMYFLATGDGMGGDITSQAVVTAEL